MRVIIAARLSRKPTEAEKQESQARQREREELAIEWQDQRAREWCRAEGHEVIDTAADYKSGTVAPWDRKNLRPWVKRGSDKTAQYDAIVAYKTDRLSRGSDEDFSRIEAWAADNHKKLIIVGPGGGIWYPARGDSDYWQWAAAKRQAHTEWEDIRARSMNRQAELRAAGKLVGKPPFGYHAAGTKFDKTLEPTAEGREYVPQIFARVADGETLLRVCAWLDAEGVRTNSKASEQWSPRTVADIIRNRTYIGERVSHKTGAVVLRVEPLVDPALWRKAGKALDLAGTVARGRGPVNQPPALLTGSLFCGRCGSPMYRHPSKGSTANAWVTYYRCYGRYPERKGCGTLVSVPLLDKMVNDEMLADRQPVLTARWVGADDPGHDLEEIQRKLNGLPARGLSDEDEDAERKRLRAERDRLQQPADPPHWEMAAHTHGGEVVSDPLEMALRDDLITNADAWQAADLPGRRTLLATMRVTFAWDADKNPVVSIGPVDLATALRS
jgi:DNA invertase Pin-like site-specific DNA recombinase